MYIAVKARVSFHWTLFALCSLCVCVHVLVCSQRPSSAVWSGVQMVELGPAEGERLSLLVSFPLPYSCSLSSLFVRGFTYQVTPLTTCSLSSLHLLRAILGAESFPLSIFSLRSSLCASQGSVRQLYMVALE